MGPRRVPTNRSSVSCYSTVRSARSSSPSDLGRSAPIASNGAERPESHLRFLRFLLVPFFRSSPFFSSVLLVRSSRPFFSSVLLVRSSRPFFSSVLLVRSSRPFFSSVLLVRSSRPFFVSVLLLSSSSLPSLPSVEFFCSSALLLFCSSVPPFPRSSALLLFCSSALLFLRSPVLLLFCSSALLLFCSSALLFLRSPVLLLFCSSALLLFCSSVPPFFCSSESHPTDAVCRYRANMKKAPREAGAARGAFRYDVRF